MFYQTFLQIRRTGLSRDIFLSLQFFFRTLCILNAFLLLLILKYSSFTTVASIGFTRKSYDVPEDRKAILELDFLEGEATEPVTVRLLNDNLFLYLYLRVSIFAVIATYYTAQT